MEKQSLKKIHFKRPGARGSIGKNVIVLIFIKKKKKKKGAAASLTAAHSLATKRRKCCLAEVRSSAKLSLFCHLYMGRSGKEAAPLSHLLV